MTQLDPLHVLWRHIAPRVPRAIANSSTWLDGYPSGGGSTNSRGDRTSTVAERHLDLGDHHGAQRRELERAILRVADLVDRLAPTLATADHLATKTSDTPPSGSCESCWRDAGHRSPTRDPGGRLCRWCADMARHLNADTPPLVLVQRHTRGQRVTDRDIRAATGGRHG